MPKHCVVIPSERNLDVKYRLLEDESADCIARLVLSGKDNDDPLNVIPTILIREPVRLFVFHHPQTTEGPNIRATRLAMACGYFSMRLKGRVVVTLSEADELLFPAVIAATQSCDLRLCDKTESKNLPEWLLGACRNTYHDAAALQRFASVMQPRQSDPNCTPNAHMDSDENSDQNDTELAPTTESLCLFCRRQTSRLCSRCDGVYFCDSICEEKG